MTTGDWAFILIIIVTGIAAIVCGVAWKVAFEDGREAGALHERNTGNESRLRQGRTSRATGELWGPEPDKFDDWLRDLSGDNERLARTGELRQLNEYRPADTATGSFRTLLAAQTDAFITQMQAEEGAYRKDLAS
jgi:hypothetical protein